FRPASVIDLVARALAELLKPDRLSVVLLDAETNRLAVTYDTNPVPARTDDPLLQLALRRGPLAFPRDVREEARRRGAELGGDAPGSWIGAPLVAAGRTMGAVSVSSDRPGALGKAELTLVSLVLAQGAIALENARLVELRAAERVQLLTAIPMAEPGSAVLVFEDQTDRRRLQEQLIQSEKMSAIGQLIAGVAHDLNNPLASVVGFSDFLAEAGVPAS